MKKTLLTLTMAVLFLVGVSPNGFALTIDELNDESYWEPAGGWTATHYGTTDYGAGLGEYLGTGPGNLSDPETIDFFTDSGYSDVTLTSLTTTSGPGNIAGTWTATDPVASENFVDFIIVKGGESFSVHRYYADTYGIWNVGWLADAGGSGAPAQMSHVGGVYTGGIPGNGNGVPEPTTLILLGAGLIGLLGLKRKFKTRD